MAERQAYGPGEDYDRQLYSLKIAEERIEEARTNKLSRLDLSNLLLEEIPKSILNCKDLIELSLRGNRIDDLSMLSSLDRLSVVFLADNQLRNISQLNIPPQVVVLDLSYNISIRDFGNIGILSNIQSLILNACELEDLFFLHELKKLKQLSLSGNMISNIQIMEKFNGLETIDLSSNRVRNVNSLLNLRKLRWLDLSNNKVGLEGLRAILEIRSLKELRMEANPIEEAPPERLNNLEALREYFGIQIHQSTSTPPPKSSDEESNSEVTSEPDGGFTSKESRSTSVGRIALVGAPEENLIDVEQLSKIYYDFIAESETNVEKFFGLFGRWGRGKTFLWKFMKEKHLEKEKYIAVEFHAWKYQDTPGLWAYLYSTLNKEYFDEAKRSHKSRTGRFFARVGRLIKLNNERGKVVRPILVLIGGISLVSAFYIFLISQIDFFKSITAQIITFIGIFSFSVYGLIDYLIKKYKNDAKQVYSQITSNVNFRSQLGLQHEIQEELKYLLKAWLPQVNKKGDNGGKIEVNRRILLFIDDIDRCSEDKIIQIVDYIRVLLDDDEIKSRITILAAIDERILIHAIQNKYRKFIENKDNDATYKELCREYMDKLFLSGLKLGPLTEYEREEMVNGFTKPYLKKIAEKIIETITTENGSGSPEQKQTSTIPNPPIASQTASDNDSDEPPQSETYSLEDWEQEFLKKLIAESGDLTPRNIRVFTYRYLLGKKLIEKPLQNETKPSYQQWYYTREARKCYALKLYHYSFRSDVDSLYANYRTFMKDYDESNPSKTIKENIYNLSLDMNQELGSIMYQVLTMIVAY